MANFRIVGVYCLVLLGSLLLVAACQPAGGFLTPEERAWLQQHQGELETLIGYDDPPYGYYNAEGQYVGIVMDHLAEIENQLGIKFAAKNLETWDELVEYSKTGRNFIVTGIAQTDSRVEYLSFTNPLIKEVYVIVTGKNSDLTRMDDLVGHKVCTTANYAVNEYIARYFPQITPETYISNLIGLRAVATGDCEAMIVSQLTASYLIDSQGLANLKIAGESGYVNRLGAAVSINDPMLFNIVDKAVDRISPGRQQEIYRKWVNTGSTGIPQSVLIGLAVAASMAVALLAIMWLWSISLRRQVRKQTRQIAASEEKFRSYVENAPGGIFVTDENGNYVEVNAAAEKMTGYSRTELLAMNLIELIPPENYQEGQAHFETVRNTGKATADIPFIKKDGSPNTWTVDAVKLPGNRFLGFVTDITERKQLEEENKRLASQFYQAQKMEAIGQLAGGIAHDFNNLLVPIIGYAELGQMSLSADHPLQANFAHITKAANRAANLTRQILAFSRKQIMEMKLADLNQLITDFEKMLSRLLPEDITLHVQLNPRLRPIKADQSQLEQVLLNLVVNARDAMPSGGTLTIETDLAPLDEAYASQHPDTKPGLYVLLAVSDTGHGIDAKIQQHIFEPFFTTKERGHGTGLGLATVFGIVKQHQGNIWVYSEPEQGTTFKVYLPVAAETVPPTPAPKDTPAEQLGGSETIVVVEDEAGVRQLAAYTLRAHGYNILEAADSTEALELVAGYPETIHLLLTDVVMPGMNGRQLYTALAKLRPNLKVLFMSGYTDNVITHHGVLDAEVAFLAKPFAVINLLRKVREVLS